MNTQRSHHLKRGNLFLVRLWNDDAPGEGGKAAWRGRVQRVVDGESHQFDDWQDLTETLMLMLSKPETAPRNGGVKAAAALRVAVDKE